MGLLSDGDGDSDDRDEDDRDDADKESSTATSTSLPDSIPSLSYSGDGVGRDNVFRSREISASRLDRSALSSLSSRGFITIRSVNTDTLGSGIVARLQTPSNIDAEEALEVARRLAPQSIFDFSHLYGPSEGRATYARSLVKLPSQGNCVTRIDIGLIDSKVTSHDSLRGIDIVNRRFSDKGASGIHGTAVASIIFGDHPDGPKLARNGRLFAAEVFNAEKGDLVADAMDLIAAIDWMLESGVKVVNMSLSGPRNDLIGDAIASAARQGLIIVAAAGNGGPNGGPRYPAAYDNVIATAAVDARLRPYRRNSSGEYIDIAAPGVNVWGADVRTGGGALWTGTSFAAPYVTVEIAAAVERGLVSNPAEAEAYLRANALDIGPRGVDGVFGAGLLQSRSCF